jgi:hypothetical protein
MRPKDQANAVSLQNGRQYNMKERGIRCPMSYRNRGNNECGLIRLAVFEKHCMEFSESKTKVASGS